MHELIVEIKEKANRALSNSGECLAGHSFKAVTQLRNGGILLKLDSKEVVTWFYLSKTIWKKFSPKFHKTLVIRPRAFHVVVQFIPLMLHLERLADLRDIEETNGMDEGDILKARWIKPIKRCSPLQVCKHLILSCSLQVPVNEALQDGLFICHMR